MRRALAMGARNVGGSGANPSVGCVLVDRAGRIIARGVTGAGGAPHAEAAALDAARAIGAADRLIGATAYVTLEPCAHHGRTPPCADALAAAGVGRVVFALEDPDAKVCGRGAARLRDAGIVVDVGVGAAAAREQLAPYLTHRRTGRAHATLKLATSFDGKIALATGESQWISCAAARARAHMLRARADAVLVGTGTVLADDPRLTVRSPGLEHMSPIRVVADRRLRTPLRGQLVAEAPTRPLWLFCADDADPDRRSALEAAGARVSPIPTNENGLDLHALVDRLGEAGVVALLVEGGGRIAASLLASDLIDRIALATAGVGVGGDGLPALGSLGLDRLDAAPRFALSRVERVGSDVWSEWTRRAQDATT